MRLASYLFIVLLGATVASVLGATTSEAPSGAVQRKATFEEIQALFSRVTRLAPRQFHLTADVQVLTPAWTEKTIKDELKHQEKIMAQHDRQATTAQLKELRSLRLDAIRKAHSGTNIWSVEVWISDDFYRKDEVWVSIPKPSKHSYVWIGNAAFTNAAFTNVSSFIVNQTVESATLYTTSKSPVSIDPLWEGWTLEPMFALPLLAAVTDTNKLTRPGAGIRPFASMNLALDPEKARDLMDGTHKRFQLDLSRVVWDGNDSKSFRLEAKNAFNRKAFVASYWIDAANPDRLYQVELESSEGVRQFSTREGVASNGWPRTWTSQTIDIQGRVITKRVIYHKVDLNNDFGDRATFAPVFPTNFIVSISSGEGFGQRIQNPFGAKPLPQRANSIERTRTSRYAYWIVIVTLLILPLIFSRHRLHQRAKDP